MGHLHLKLLTGLCASFWKAVHPAWDDENPDNRFAPLVWLNDKLSLQIKQLPITQPANRESQVYTWADWESAMVLERAAQKDATILQAATAAGKATQARFLERAALTSTDFYLTFAMDIHRTLEASTALERCLETACGTTAPSLSRFTNALVQMQSLVDYFLQERGVRPAEPAVLDEEAYEAGMNVPAETLRDRDVLPNGPIHSRAEAYRRLTEAADYLLTTEPHSPTPYLVKRAVAWGSMSLTELLHEFVQNPNDLRAIYNLLGIRENA